ncbi:MAG: TetR/AcrR family transcriptional regulator [Patulibacter minatonensis]
MSTEVPNVEERPLRADARRNRDRILVAARQAFAESGPDVAVSEILRIAGVGSGTLFRHFPTKQDLLLAVLEQTFDELSDAVSGALELEDPWASIVKVLTLTATMQSKDAAFLASVGPEMFSEPTLQARNEAMMARVGAVVERAQAAGVLRDDIVATDLPFIVAAIGGATESCVPGLGAESPELWRRYLQIVLDGLRPEGASPLPEDAPTLDELRAIKAQKHAER